MACAHQSIKQKTPGNRDDCISCNLPIIYTARNKWEWYYGISNKERKALEIVKSVDEIHREQGLEPHG